MKDNGELQRLAARLPREIQPPRDLWPGIAARIGARRRRYWPAYGAAASLFMAIGALAGWLATQPAPDPGVAQVTPGAYSDSGYWAGRNLMAASLTRDSGTLPEVTRDDVARNLRLIQDAIIQIHLALEKDQNNGYLRGLLNQAYQDEARLLATIQRLQTNPYLRTEI